MAGALFLNIAGRGPGLKEENMTASPCLYGPATPEAHERMLRQQARESLSRAIDTWLLRTNAGGAKLASQITASNDPVPSQAA